MISWITGMILWGLWLIPLIIGAIIFAKELMTDKGNDKLFIISIILMIIGLICLVLTPIVWHYTIEVDSVDSKIVTVGNWQPKPGLDKTENGLMVIDSADDLMMVTSDGEGFLNEENFLFWKFDTRDILNQLKPGGIYRIQYFGWREGFNNGFPNILSVEVIDDSNATAVDLNQYMGNRIVGV